MGVVVPVLWRNWRCSMTKIDLPAALPVEGQQLLKVREVARRINRSKSNVHEIIDRGDLPAVWLGGEKRVRPEDLDAYIASLQPVRPTRL